QHEKSVRDPFWVPNGHLLRAKLDETPGEPEQHHHADKSVPRRDPTRRGRLSSCAGSAWHAHTPRREPLQNAVLPLESATALIRTLVARDRTRGGLPCEPESVAHMPANAAADAELVRAPLFHTPTNAFR